MKVGCYWHIDCVEVFFSFKEFLHFPQPCTDCGPIRYLSQVQDDQSLDHGANSV